MHTRSESALRWLSLALLAAAIVAIATVPDRAILRDKFLWGRGLLVAAGAVLLLSQVAAGHLATRWPLVLGMTVLPGLIAGLHPFHTDLASPALARDEIERLLLLPLALWVTGTLLGTSRERRNLLLLLALCGIVVGGRAVLERTAGILPPWLGIDPSSRAQAGFGNPIFLGAWLVLVTPLLVVEGLTGPPSSRWPCAVAAGLCMPAILATGSAGGWMGFAVAVGVALALALGRQAGLRRWLLAGAAALVVLLAMINTNVLLRPRAHTIIWRDSLDMFLDQPAGVGPGQYATAFLPYASDELLELYPRHATIVNDAHCEPLQLLIELGWVAGPVFALLAWVLWKALRSAAAAPTTLPESGRFIGAVAGVSGSLAQSLVSPDLRFVVSMLVLGMLLGFLSSFAPLAVRRIPGGLAGRLAIALLALGALAWTGRETYRGLTLARLVPRSEPVVADPAQAAQLRRLRAAAAARPDDPKAHYDLAVALTRAERFGEAVVEFRRTLVLRPDHTEVVRSLGLLESLAGDFPAAVGHLRQALDERPEDRDARYHLALSAFMLGDVLTAIQEVEELLERHPDHAHGRLLLQRLRE